MGIEIFAGSLLKAVLVPALLLIGKVLVIAWMQAINSITGSGGSSTVMKAPPGRDKGGPGAK